MRPTIVQGWDISLNHGAVVQLRNGELDGFWFYSDKVGSVARGKAHGARVEMPTATRQPDKHIRAIIRLDWVTRWIERIALAQAPGFVALEDYALGADQGAHQIGEIGGHARRLLWLHGARYRLHDPIAVKLFVAHDGSAQKDLIETCVRERWGADFSRYNALTVGKGKPSRQTSEDLADAFGLAQMVWTEFQLRKGLVRMSALHEKEIQVFNRATKAFPISVLGREWIRNGNAKPKARVCANGRCVVTLLDERKLLSERAIIALSRSAR
jgi:Holliday junction resolvasome RuvABC endonuclease subunit